MGLTTKEIGSSSFNDMISSVDRRSEYVENRANANVTLNNFLTPYTLDNKSSILNAPCGYSNGTYASLRPVQTIGPELVANGTFDTDSDWNKGSAWSIANGQASFDDSTNSSLTQSKSFDVNKKYRINFEITSGSGSIAFLSSNGVNTYVSYSTYNVGTHTADFVYSSGSGFGIFGSSFLGGAFSIDNVSVKEVTDADFDFSRGSSATRVNEKGLIEDVQILSGELVQNGDFEEIGSELASPVNFSDDWLTTGATSITENTFQASGSGIGVYFPLTINKIYKVKVSNVSGDISIRYRTSNGGAGTVAGNFDEFIYVNTYNSTTPNIYLRANSETTVTIGNVSVKEVGQNWTFNTGWSIEDGVAYYSGTTNADLAQSGILTSGKLYKLQYEVINSTLVNGVVKLSGTTASAQNVLSQTVGTHTLYFTANGTAPTSFNIRIVLNTSGQFEIDNISVVEVTNDTDIPRIDYTGGQGALLLEPQRTNLTQYSEAFDNAVWTKSNSTISPNQIISPDGTQNADKLITNNGLINGQVHYNISKSASQITYTSSIFVKKAEWDRIGLYITDASTFDNRGQAFFNLDGTLGTVASAGTFTNASSNIEEYPNDWYRVYLTVTVPSTTTTIVSRYYSLDNTELNGDGTSGIYIWGAQSEVGDYPTSIIKTEGSTVTRSADVANNSGNADLFNDSEGVLYAEIAALADDLTFRSISISSDAGYNNSIMIRYISTSNQVNVITRIGGALNNTSVDVNDITEFNKIAFKYKSEDCALFINGVKVATSTQAFNSSGINNLSFDRGGGVSPFYGNLKSVAVFKEALTDEELAQITSATQQEVFYQMRDRMNIKNYDYYEFGDYTTRLKKLF